MRAPLLACVLASGIAPLLVTGAALADEPSPALSPLPPPAPMPAAPDIVKLKDGSLYRGTIAELVAGDHVDLVLMNGETRRFALADVAYAGNATAEPPPSPPAPSPTPLPHTAPRAGRGAYVRVEANQPDVELHIKTGETSVQGLAWGYRTAQPFYGVASSYATVCIAPCTEAMSLGPHRLALSMGKGSIVDIEDAVTITGPGTLRAEYESRLGTRIAGLLTFVGADVLGLGMVYAGFAQSKLVCDGDYCGSTPVDSTLVGAGFAVMGVGSVVGLVLMLQHDKAEVTFLPGAPAALAGHAGMESGTALGAASGDPRGAMVRVRF